MAAAALVAAGVAALYGHRPRYVLHAGSTTLVGFGHRGSGRLEEVRFYSRALGRVADYLVYLPAQYTPTKRLPVFYMLHGMPGRPMAFTVNAGVETKLQSLIRRRLVSPMILVFPDGRINGRTQTDSEWANTPAGRYESYVVNVVHNVDRRFATLPYRQDRAIAGLSAGAYGAANVGLHHVALFSLIEVWSGYFIETHSGVFAHATRAQLADNSPMDYVSAMRRALRTYPLRAFLYSGTRDPNRAQVKPMAAALAAAGAHVGYAIYPGGHSWNLWAPRVDQMLIMASHDFAHPLTRPAARGAVDRRQSARARARGAGAAVSRSGPLRTGAGRSRAPSSARGR